MDSSDEPVAAKKAKIDLENKSNIDNGQGSSSLEPSSALLTEIDSCYSVEQKSSYQETALHIHSQHHHHHHHHRHRPHLEGAQHEDHRQEQRRDETHSVETSTGNGIQCEGQREDDQLQGEETNFQQLEHPGEEKQLQVEQDEGDQSQLPHNPHSHITATTSSGETLAEDSNGLSPSRPPMSPSNSDSSDTSALSAISELSGVNWKPEAGPYAWVQTQMMSGVDPEALLSKLCPAVHIPSGLDTMTLWKIVINLITEPPRRKKLEAINTISDVVNLIRNANKIVVLTGAGVSVSCGIPDFRSRDGIYSRLAVDFPDLPDPQSMFDITYFRRDPRPFFKFAREIYPGQYSPSPCHNFIRNMEKQGKLLRNYTQNIDTLEQMAGIESVVQCHGSFATASCTKCGSKCDAELIREDIFNQRIPLCAKCPPTQSSSSEASSSSSSSSSSLGTEWSSQPIMKPDIVFFGEGLGDVFHDAVAQDKDEVDLLIMIGSSLKVRPVALIPSSVPDHVPQVLINRERLPHLSPDVELLGDCDVIVNQLAHMLGPGWGDAIHRKSLRETEKLIEHPKTEMKSRPNESGTSNVTKGERSKRSSVGDLSNSDTPDSSLASVNIVESDVSVGDNVKAPPPTSSTVLEGSRETNGKENENELGNNYHDDDPDNDDDEYAVKSVSALLLPETFFFAPPNRYVFPGAEVLMDEDDSNSSSSSSSSSPTSPEPDQSAQGPSCNDESVSIGMESKGLEGPSTNTNGDQM